MVLPNKNPKTGHTIGCTCDYCQEYFRRDNLEKFGNRYWDDD